MVIFRKSRELFYLLPRLLFKEDFYNGGLYVKEIHVINAHNWLSVIVGWHCIVDRARLLLCLIAGECRLSSCFSHVAIAGFDLGQRREWHGLLRGREQPVCIARQRWETHLEQPVL